MIIFYDTNYKIDIHKILMYNCVDLYSEIYLEDR